MVGNVQQAELERFGAGGVVITLKAARLPWDVVMLLDVVNHEPNENNEVVL